MSVTEKMKKLLSMLLCLCMLAQNGPFVAFAATTDNLCEHHTEHTAECGYREGSAGSACTHEHSESCYEILECLHTHSDKCEDPCTHECTVDNGCITMELDCHHVHGDCGYAEAVAPQDCTTCQSVLTHAENCGYVAPVAEVTCLCGPGEDGVLVHTDGCGYVAPVEEVTCKCEPTVTHGGEGCTYVEGKTGSPCTHSHSVKVNSADSCYKLLCSHADGGHDNSCGYVAQSEGSPCTYTCREDHGMVLADPVCTCEIACGKDNGINPNCTVCLEDFWLCSHFDPTVCSCAEKCTEETVNFWCPVCSEGIAGCGGTDSAAVFAAASVPTVDTNHIYANGTPLYIEAGTSSGTAVYYMSGSQKVYVNTNEAAGNDLSNTIIWGGYDGNALDGDVHITMTGGQITRINGSGFASDTKSGYVNNVNITITGGTVSDDINAGWRNPVRGNVNITMTGGSVGTVYGCCAVAQNAVGNADVRVHGDVNITVTGGTVSQIHGGDGKRPVNGTVSGLITVPVSFLNDSTVGSDETVYFDNLLYKNGSNYIHRGTVTIPAGVTMTVAAGETLTIPANATLINNGTLVNNGTITINGVLRNNGSFVNNGTVNRNAAYITTAFTGTPSVWANGSAVSGAATEYVDGKLYIYGVTGNIKATLNGQTYYGCQRAGTATELTTEYVCVTEITGIPAQIAANKAVPLQAVLTPETTTLPQTISYEVVNDGGTGAAVSGNTLTAYGPGTVTLRVKATDGYSPCTKDFSIPVNFVPVTGLSAAVPSYPGTHTLPGVAPANASYQSIVWTLVDAGDTGASLSGNKLTIQNTGTLKLSCVVKNGLDYGTDYTQDFTVTVKALDYVDISKGSVTITQKDAQTLTVAYSGFDGGFREYAVGEPISVTGTSTNQYTISVESGVATILLDNCSISYHNYSDSPLSVASGAVLHLKLSGNNSLTHTSNAMGPITKNAALRVPSGATLTIDGDGSLEATGGDAGAGIGGGDRESCGTITINGGTITATGGETGAGIGGGNDGSGGTITINGGVVTATVPFGGGIGAGIGSGDEGSGGTITINGGTVSATAYRSPIGANSGTAEKVVITGGSVYAYSTSNKFEPISAVPTDGNGNPLVLNTITLDGVTAQVAVTAVEEMSYSINDVYTLDTNKLYFYLPANTAATSITAGGVEYICKDSSLTYYASHDWSNKDGECAHCGETCEHEDQTGSTCSICGAALHTHDWKYETVGTDTIRATCAAEGCTLQNASGGSVTISNPDSMVYSGEPIEAVVTGSFTNSATYDVHYEAKSGSALSDAGKPVNAGEYTAILTVSEGSEAKQTVSIDHNIAKVSLTKEDLTFKAPDSLVYDGNGKEAAVTSNIPSVGAVTVIYYETVDNMLVPVDGIPTDAGTYIVKAAVDAGSNNEAAALEDSNWKFTITQAAGSVTDPTDLKATYGDTLSRITLPDGWTWENAGAPVGDAGSRAHSAVYTPGAAERKNYDFSTVSGWDASTGTVKRDLTVTVDKAAGSGSVSIQGWTYGGTANAPVPVSTTNGTDSVTYQYKIKGTDTSTDPINAGEYTVQATFAATANYEAVTATADFTIAQAEPAIGAVTAATVENTTKLSAITLTRANTEVDGNLTVDAGQTLQLGDNTIHYTFTPTSDNYKTVTGTVCVTVVDTIAPNGTVKLEDNSWTEFLNGITFGLFFNKTVEVSVEAEDSFSGVATIEYYETADILDLDGVKALSDDKWTEMRNGKVIVTAVDAKQFIYYIRITDKSGNAGYLATNGAEFDTRAPVIGIQAGTYYTTRKVTVTEANLRALTLNGDNVTAPVTVPGDEDTTYTIVATDKAGNQATVTVIMKPIASLDDAIADLTENNATSADLDDIQSVLDAVTDLLEDETIPEDEKDKLEEIQKQAQNLKDAVEEAQTAIDNDVTQKVEDKNETNVELDDKTDLEKAKDTLEDALSDENKGNYTPTEQAEIQQEIDRLEKAIEAIEQTEAVIDAIEKLPSSVEPDLNEADEKAIRNAKDAYDKLSDYQKSLIDKADKDKLEKLFDILDDYEITKGNKQKWEKGSGKALVFTANGPDRKFKELRIDGKVVGTSNYTHKDGSTIITLKASYLQTLSTGKHTIQVVYTDGETGGKDYFRIYNSGGNPSTGDNMNLMLMSGVAMTSLLCIAMMIMFVLRKKGKYQR